MKIAIPLAAGRLAMHFGHCEQFAFFDVDEKDTDPGSPTLAEPPGYEPGVLPRWLKENGVNLIIAGAIGQRAQQFFEQFGMSVLVGAPTAEPAEIVAAYLSGDLQTGQNICDH